MLLPLSQIAAFILKNKTRLKRHKTQINMKNWFEVTAKYSKMGEDGLEKKVNETYLLDAVSFTEAEAIIHRELKMLVSGEFTVVKIARTNFSELILDNIGDRYFKGKVTFVTFDDDSGKEKRIAQNVLVHAETVEQADKYIKEAMKGMMTDFEITAIAETKIVDVFLYSEEGK